MKLSWARSPRASAETLVRLFAQLAIARRSGLALADAMQIIAQDVEGDAASRSMLQGMAAHLRAGGSLSDGLQKSGARFAPETIALVRKAEGGEGLAQVLEALARDFEHRARLHVAARAAVTWPAIALAFFLLVLLVLAVFVIPVFSGLFASFGAQLPVPTRIFIAVSQFIASWWWVLIPLFAVLFFLGNRYRTRWAWIAGPLDALAMATPVWRGYLARTLASRLATILTAAAEGAPLRESLAHLRATAGNRRLASRLAAFESRVAAGLGLADAVKAAPDLPGRLRVAVELGERTGMLAAALRQAQAVTDEEAERSLVRVEQVTLIVAYLSVGILVGLVVIAMYLPIFKMGSVI